MKIGDTIKVSDGKYNLKRISERESIRALVLSGDFRRLSVRTAHANTLMRFLKHPRVDQKMLEIAQRKETLKLKIRKKSPRKRRKCHLVKKR